MPDKFFKTTITLEILSEEPFEWDNLKSIYYSITHGDCSGLVVSEKSETINKQQLIERCEAHGTDSDFFLGFECEEE